MQLKIEKLGKICEVIRGGSPRPMGDPKYFVGKIPFIKISDITKDDLKYVIDSKTKVNEAGAKKSRLLSKGSLILSNSGSVCIPKFLAVDACIHDGFVSFINFKTEVELNYLYHFFNYTRPYVIQKHKQGITQVNLNISIVSDFDIPLPPLPEQKKIVEKIEELFSGLDSGVASLKKAKEQIRLYRQSVLSAAFSGKLVKDEKRETKEELLTHLNGVQGAAKAAEPQVGYAKDLPEGWKWVKLKHCVDKIVVGYVGPIKEFLIEKDGIPFLSTTHIGENEFIKNEIRFVKKDFHLKQKKSVTIPGDIIIARHGDSGKACIVPDLYKEYQVSNAVLLKTNSNNVSPRYLCYALNYFRTLLQKKRVGAVFQVVNTQTMSEFEIILPTDLIQQTQIVEEIEKRFSEADNLEKAIDESLAKSETLRQSILKQAFEGRLI